MFFLILWLWNSVYFILTIHLNLVLPAFRCSVTMCGCWLPYWTLQVSPLKSMCMASTQHMPEKHMLYGILVTGCGSQDMLKLPLWSAYSRSFSCPCLDFFFKRTAILHKDSAIFARGHVAPKKETSSSHSNSTFTILCAGPLDKLGQNQSVSPSVIEHSLCVCYVPVACQALERDVNLLLPSWSSQASG